MLFMTTIRNALGMRSGGADPMQANRGILVADVPTPMRRTPAVNAGRARDTLAPRAASLRPAREQLVARWVVEAVLNDPTGRPIRQPRARWQVEDASIPASAGNQVQGHGVARRDRACTAGGEKAS